MLGAARGRARDWGGDGENLKQAEKIIGSICSSFLPVSLFA